MYKVSDDLRCTWSKDGATALDVGTGKIFFLNPTASLILNGLEQLHTKSQIICEICERYNAPSEQVRADVDELLNALERNGLVHGDGAEQTR
jgi:hypothetical protein